MKAFGEWSWVFEKHLSAVDKGHIKDLKEARYKPNESFDWGLATAEAKTRCIKLYGLSAELVKAVEDSNGLDAWRSSSV